MAERSSRPFYGEYAWAFDLLIDRPVGQECAAITAWLTERGVLPDATILDAGCGTGRYAGELPRQGYAVQGVDRSSELIETARQSVRGYGTSVSFRVGDILALPAAQYHGILCRGVLNDFVTDDARRSVFAAFARALQPPGVLVLDVREWEATRARRVDIHLIPRRSQRNVRCREGDWLCGHEMPWPSTMSEGRDMARTPSILFHFVRPREGGAARSLSMRQAAPPHDVQRSVIVP